MNTKPDVERGAFALTHRDGRRHWSQRPRGAHRLQGRARLPQWSSRSYASIVRANVLTIFNLIRVGLGALTFVLRDWCDALRRNATGSAAAAGRGCGRDRAGAYYGGRDDETLLTEPSE